MNLHGNWQCTLKWRHAGDDGPEDRGQDISRVYLETVNGNVKIKEFIEGIADLDRKAEEKMIFQDTEEGWLPKAADLLQPI